MPTHEYVMVPSAQFYSERRAKSPAPYPSTFKEQRRHDAFRAVGRHRTSASANESNAKRDETVGDDNNNSSGALSQHSEERITERLLHLIDSITESKASTSSGVNRTATTTMATSTTTASPTVDDVAPAKRTLSPSPTDKESQPPRAADAPPPPQAVSIPPFYDRDNVSKVLASTVSKTRGLELYNLLMSQPSATYNSATDAYSLDENYHVSSSKLLAQYLKYFATRRLNNNTIPSGGIQRFVAVIRELPGAIKFAGPFYRELLLKDSSRTRAPDDTAGTSRRTIRKATTRSSTTAKSQPAVKLKKPPTVRRLLRS